LQGFPTASEIRSYFRHECLKSRGCEGISSDSGLFRLALPGHRSYGRADLKNKVPPR